jgi:hypothetical protein
MIEDGQRDHIERIRERIENGERDVGEADREVLLEFSDELYLVPSQVGGHRHVKLLGHNVRMAEYAGSLADDGFEFPDAEISVYPIRTP